MILYAGKTDIQAWLQPDKIVVDDANSGKPNIEATRIIKGQLTGFFAPVVVATWADPNSTPQLIRGIAGRLTASFMHATIYSEESDREISQYSQWLYDGAMALIAQILAGTLVVTDDDGNPIDTTGSGLLSFFPDNTTVPLFTIDKAFN